MAFEQYKEHVQSLCDGLRVPNPIEEKDLKVADVLFHSDGSELQVEGTDMNRAGRLFLWHLAQEHPDYIEVSEGKIRLLLTSEIKRQAEEFFTDEMWNDCGSERRTLVFGVKTFGEAVLYLIQ